MDSALETATRRSLDDEVPVRPPVASFVISADAPPAPTPVWRERLLGRPGWLFHLLCTLGALGAVWAASSPTSGVVPGGRFAWLGAACLGLWGLRVMVAVRRRAITLGYAAVPALALVVGGLTYFDVPQQARWLHAEGGFEQTLRGLPIAQEWDQAAADTMTPERLGTYGIDTITRGEAGNVQFRLDGGATFTYLVEGVTAAILGAHPGAEFEHISGNWYIIR